MNRPHTREFITRVNAEYHDAISEKYDDRLEGYHPDVLAYRRRIMDRYVFPRLSANSSPTALDFGCGSGYMEQFFDGQSRFEITGIDVAGKMLEKARVRYPDAKFIQGDLYTQAFPAVFDLTMENAVLHHLRDYETLLERMAALTRPGGVLFLGNEPNSLAYLYLGLLKWLFRHTINRKRTADAVELLGDADYESLSEYHLFYSAGLSPFKLRKLLLDSGFERVFLFFPLRELFASIEESMPRIKLNRLVPNVLRDHFLFCRNFSLVAWKR